MHSQAYLSCTKQPAWLQIEPMMTVCVYNTPNFSGQMDTSSSKFPGSCDYGLRQQHMSVATSLEQELLQVLVDIVSDQVV